MADHAESTPIMKRYLLASDFDKTLSFNDTGVELCKVVGITGFEEKVAGLAKQNFVQGGAELTYLLRHDPEFRKVRKEHLYEAGKQVKLKNNVGLLSGFLNSVSEGVEFLYYVISAGPKEAIRSALEGIVPKDHIFGTEFIWDESGEIQAVKHSRAGYGKVKILHELQAQLNIAQDRIIYVGDGSSDIHVMLHVNRLQGLTISVAENKSINEVAKRIVSSDDAISVAVPILEEVMGKSPQDIRSIFESRGFQIQEWDKLTTDSLEIGTDT